MLLGIPRSRKTGLKAGRWRPASDRNGLNDMQWERITPHSPGKSGGPERRQVESQAQTRLVVLDSQQVIGAFGLDGLDDGLLAPLGINGHQRALQLQHLQQARDGDDLVIRAVDASRPRTKRCWLADAETRCRAARPLALSPLRREVLPSTATISYSDGKRRQPAGSPPRR